MNKQTAKGTFKLTWEGQPPYDSEPGAQISRATVTKKYEGDINGTSVAELITAITDVEESAGYVGIERVKGSVGGKEGSFVFQHSAISDAKTGQILTLQVVPDSATGALTGLRGNMQIDASGGVHEYEFGYYFLI